MFRIVLICMLAGLVGCGGSGGSTNSNATGTSVTITFSGTPPSVVALQKGTDAFAAASLQGNQLNFALPSGTTKFAFAWVCGPFENMIEATTQDNLGTIDGCGAPSPTPTPLPKGSATGNVDASAIAGASGGISVIGKAGLGGFLPSASSFSFNLMMLDGLNDIAVTAFDNNGQAAAVRILRAQTVPGPINGGNTITLGPGDLVSAQPVSFTNVPAGFGFPPNTSAEYVTAGGTNVLLSIGNVAQYLAVPAAAAQSGDGYLFVATTGNDNSSSLMYVFQTTTNGGGPVTIALPNPWVYTGPSPGAFPTFAFNYSGFSGVPTTSQTLSLQWPTNPVELPNPPPPQFFLNVLATPAYGASTITIPNLTAVPGFFAPATGNQVSWKAFINGGAASSVAPSPSIQPNGLFVVVENLGQYMVP